MELRIPKNLKVTPDGYLELKISRDGNCSNRATYYLRKIRNLAQEKGGKCLSYKYHKITSKLKFTCEFESNYIL